MREALGKKRRSPESLGLFGAGREGGLFRGKASCPAG
jgi:hypothetical protein